MNVIISERMVELLYVNQGVLEKCDKEENVEVTRAAIASCLKRRKQNVLSYVMYSPRHRQAGARVIIFQLKLRNAPE